MKKLQATAGLTGLLVNCFLSGQSLCAQVSQDSSLLSKFDFAIVVHGGATFKSHQNLSDMLLNNSGISGTGAYFNSGLGFHLKTRKVHEIVYVYRTSFSTSNVDGSQIEVNDVYGSVSLGYEFNWGRGFKLIPNLGIMLMETEILYKSGNNHAPSVSTYLAGNGDVYRLLSERYYARAGGLLFYTLAPENIQTFFPLDIGLNVEYAHAVHATNWKRGIATAIEGPDVFDYGFYAGIVVAWWL
jgi:hypothetical protein